MARTILKQAINTSIKELREIADRLEKEAKDSKLPFNKNQKWLVSIVNKKPECSDTWEFEK